MSKYPKRNPNPRHLFCIRIRGYPNPYSYLRLNKMCPIPSLRTALAAPTQPLQGHSGSHPRPRTHLATHPRLTTGPRPQQKSRTFPNPSSAPSLSLPCASEARPRPRPRAAYFYFTEARPHKFESQTRQALLRPTGRGKGNAGKTPTPSSLPRPRGLGRRWSAAGSARVSPVLGGGAAPPGPGPRQVSAGTSTECYRPSTFVLGWVSDLASEGFQFVRLAAARMPAAGFCDDGKMCKNT